MYIGPDHAHDLSHSALVDSGEYPHYRYHGSETCPYMQGTFHGEENTSVWRASTPTVDTTQRGTTPRRVGGRKRR